MVIPAQLASVVVFCFVIDGCANLNMTASSMLSNPRMSSLQNTLYVERSRMV